MAQSQGQHTLWGNSPLFLQFACHVFAGLLLPGTLLALSGVLAFSFVAVVFFLPVFAWCFFLAASVGVCVTLL